MKREEILAKVQKITATILSIDEADCTEEKSFTADLGAESIQSVELMAGFDADFDIEMDEDGALSCNTVSDAVDFIAKYV